MKDLRDLVQSPWMKDHETINGIDSGFPIKADELETYLRDIGAAFLDAYIPNCFGINQNVAPTQSNYGNYDETENSTAGGISLLTLGENHSYDKASQQIGMPAKTPNQLNITKSRLEFSEMIEEFENANPGNSKTRFNSWLMQEKKNASPKERHFKSVKDVGSAAFPVCYQSQFGSNGFEQMLNPMEARKQDKMHSLDDASQEAHNFAKELRHIKHNMNANEVSIAQTNFSLVNETAHTENGTAFVSQVAPLQKFNLPQLDSPRYSEAYKGSNVCYTSSHTSPSSHVLNKSPHAIGKISNGSDAIDDFLSLSSFLYPCTTSVARNSQSLNEKQRSGSSNRAACKNNQKKDPASSFKRHQFKECDGIITQSRWNNTRPSCNSHANMPPNSTQNKQPNRFDPNSYSTSCNGNSSASNFLPHWGNQQNRPPNGKTKHNKTSSNGLKYLEHLQFMEAILIDLYKEEIPPSSEEIRRRLDKYNPCGISRTEFLEMCKADPQKRFRVEEGLKEAHIYLSEEPPGFVGFIDPNSLELPYSADLIPLLFFHLVDRYTVDPKGEAYKGGRFLLAELLKSSGPLALRVLSQGRLCHLLQKCLDLGLLSYENNAIRPAVACSAMCKAYFAKNSPTIKPETRAKHELQIRQRLKKILEANPLGLAMCRLPVIYKQEYESPLNIDRLGYTKLADFLQRRASDICMIKPAARHRCLVLPKRGQSSASEHFNLETNKYSGFYRLSSGAVFSRDELTNSIIQTLRSSKWCRLSTFIFWHMQVNGSMPRLNYYVSEKASELIMSLNAIWNDTEQFGEIPKFEFKNHFTTVRNFENLGDQRGTLKVKDMQNSIHYEGIGYRADVNSKSSELSSWREETLSFYESDSNTLFFPEVRDANDSRLGSLIYRNSTKRTEVGAEMNGCSYSSVRRGEAEYGGLCVTDETYHQQIQTPCFHKLLPLGASCVPAENDQFLSYSESPVYACYSTLSSEQYIEEEQPMTYADLLNDNLLRSSILGFVLGDTLDSEETYFDEPQENSIDSQPSLSEENVCYHNMREVPMENNSIGMGESLIKKSKTPTSESSINFSLSADKGTKNEKDLPYCLEKYTKLPPVTGAIQNEQMAEEVPIFTECDGAAPRNALSFKTDSMLKNGFVTETLCGYDHSIDEIYQHQEVEPSSFKNDALPNDRNLTICLDLERMNSSEYEKDFLWSQSALFWQEGA